MKDLKKSFVEIFRTERGVFLIMILNLMLSVGLLVFVVMNLNPNAAVVKIGYGDIGGYRDGVWFDMLAFLLLAILFGFFHNLIAVRIFQKRGSGRCKFFLMVTTLLILLSFLIFARLLGES